MSPTGPRFGGSLTQPSSPLSPRMDSLNVPHSQRHRPVRQHSAAASSSLRLPALPRFHPANFPSQHTSVAATPATGPNSPQVPLSPRAQQKAYSDAQKQLYTYQRELISNMAKTSPNSGTKPDSPRLIPLGSPGPVTPLELEGQAAAAGGYLMAGSSGHPALTGEYVEKLIQEETRRMQAARTSPQVASR